MLAAYRVQVSARHSRAAFTHLEYCTSNNERIQGGGGVGGGFIGDTCSYPLLAVSHLGSALNMMGILKLHCSTACFT